MATYTVTASNWNSSAFWAGISESTTGHTLDFSSLGVAFNVEINEVSGIITISDGTTIFTVGEAGVAGTDANFGGTTLLDYFTTISGTQGQDIVGGTSGNDVLDGNSGDDILWGNDGDDTLYGNGGADTLDGDAGNDLIYGGADNDEIYGWDGDDRLHGETGDDTIDGGIGADSIYGGAGADLIYGGDGDDNLEGGWEDNAADTIFGDAGNDVIFGYGGGDSLLGGNGDDWIDGGAGDDYIDGGAGQDRLVGDLGNDTILGGAGYDILTGGEGADLIYGGDDADQIWGNAGDTIFGGEGGDDNDTLYVSHVDFITYTTAESGTITFNSGETLQFSEIESVVELTPDGVVDGTAGADQIGQFYVDADGEWIDNGDAIGEGDGDSVRAGDGNDTIWAGDGDDTVHGEAGDDLFDLGSGNNVAFGGTGSDTINGGWLNDTISGDDFIATGPNLIANGSFEDTTGMSPAFYGFFGPGGSAPGWTDANGNQIEFVNNGSRGLTATDGANWLDMEAFAGEHLVVSQTVTGVSDGQVYVLSFDAADVANGNDGTTLDNQMQVVWNGDIVGTIDAVDGDWRSYEFHLIGGSGDGSNTLSFVGFGSNDAQGVSLDNVQMFEAVEAAGAGDSIAGWDGDDDLIGGAGNDTIDGGTGADMIVAGSGDDSVLGGDGLDTIWGGTGNDTIDAGADNDIVWAGEGTDNILGGTGNDTLSGNTGADTIDGGDGADSLYGGQGGDSLAGGGGADFILGDGEWLDLTDHASYAFSPATTLTVVNSADGPIELWWIDDTGVLQFYATIQPGDTYLQPTFEGHNWVLLDEDGHYLELIEGAANQTVNYGAEGLNDSIDGGDRTDTIYGQFGDDTIDGGAGADLIYGGSGNDSILGGNAADTIFGGDGNDTIDVGTGLDLAYGEAGDDLLIDGSTGPEAATLHGGDGSDTIQSGTGDAFAEYFGDAGDDQFEDRGGNNQTYDGGTGSDTYVVLNGLGNDTVIGGEDPGDTDIDVIDLSALGAGVSVTFTGDEAGTITDGTNTLTFSEIEQIILTDEADVVNATADPNGVVIDAAGGDDTVTGSVGDDTLIGGEGADSISGGDGNDVLYGGNGPDGPNLIADSSFEGATPTSWGQVSLLSDWYSWNNSTPDLAAEGGYEPGTSNSAAPTDGTNYVSMVSNGDFFVEGISQDLATPLLAGVTYTIQLDAAAGGYNNTAPLGDALQLLLYGNETPGQVGASNSNLPPGATLLGSVEVNTAYTSGTMEPVSITFTPTTDIATLSISLQDADFNGTFAMLTIDNVGLWEGDAPDESNDTIDGGAGDDTIDGGSGDDLLLGGAGADEIQGGNGNDTLFGGDGDDTISGGDGADTIIGGAGADLLEGGADADTFILTDGFGNDTIIGGDTFTTGTNYDTIDLTALSNPVSVIFSAPGAGTIIDSVTGDMITFLGIESLLLTEHDDIVDATLDDGTTSILAGGGDDTITVSGGADVVQGMDGADTYFVTDGFGGTHIDGGTGNDLIDLNGLSSGVEVVFTGPNAGTITDRVTGDVMSFENIVHLILTDQDDIVDATMDDGTTYIETRGGEDSLTGTNTGGLYDDHAFDPNGQGNDTFTGGDGDDVLWMGTDDDLAMGGEGNDEIYGQEGNDTLLGEGGNDTLGGGFDDDSLSGGDGADLLSGDYPVGGASVADGSTVWGSTAQDAFVFDGASGTSATIILDDGAGTANDGDDARDVIFVTDTGAGASLTVEGFDYGVDWITTAEHWTSSTVTEVAPGNHIVTLTYANGNTQSFNVFHDNGTVFDLGESFAVHAGNDTLDGGTGNDTIYGGGGDDLAYGWTGDDVLYGEDGDDTLFGQDGNDTILGGSGNDYLDGDDALAGADSISGGDGNDTIIGDGGMDTLLGGADDDVIFAGADDDSVLGGTGNDQLYGEDGNDYLDGGAGDDTIIGGEGHDTIIGFEGNDSVLGGAGDDVINTRTSPGTGVPDEGYGTLGDPLYYAGDSDAFNDRDTVDGGAGNDSILTGDDNDIVFGGDGADTVDAGFDDDFVSGGAGMDVLEGNEGNDTIDGGADDDIIYGDVAPTNPDYLFFAPYDLPNDGTDLAPNNNADSLMGGDGNDTIYGQDDNDTLEGGLGNDFLDGGNDDDYLDGGEGADTLLGGAGNDTLLGGNDASADLLDGGAGNDDLSAGDGNDTLLGGDGNDTLFGGGDNDLLDGGNGDDTLDGWTGDDTLTGGLGDDQLTGGDGNDTFVYTPGDGLDTITDFNFGNTGALDDGDTTNNDFIDLSAYYDRIAELHDDYADDGILNQSNSGNIVKGQVVDYSNNTSFDTDGTPDNEGIVFLGQTPDGSSFTQENTGVVCFTSGVMILTETGERPVESLRPGDRIVTRDNGVQPLQWIAKRDIDEAQLKANDKLRPVLIQPDLIGASAPLLVSQQHGMLVRPESRDEVLIRAIHLARIEGGKARVARGVRRVTYIHLMFDAHQIVFANGAPSESFYPGPMALGALAEPAREELRMLFPELCSNVVTSVYGGKVCEFARIKDLPAHLSDIHAA